MSTGDPSPSFQCFRRTPKTALLDARVARFLPFPWLLRGASTLYFALLGGCAGLLVGCAGQVPRDDAAARGRQALSEPEAEREALELVNRDREEHGLRPVAWDPIAARAARRHAEDMCRNGFTAHQGTDGSVPEQRYTEAGGVHMLQENAAGFFDARKRELERRPRFDLAELEYVHLEFMNEVPPADGHRQNVLGARHTSVGIGLARAKGRGFPCLVQVFTDHYGRYAPLPAELRVGAVLRIAGEVFEPARFAGIGVARIDWERPLAPDVLNQRAGYRFPEPDELYFPPGYASRVPVRVEGRAFSLDLPLSGGEPGRYLISVWARFPGSESLVMVSLRTVRVTR